MKQQATSKPEPKTAVLATETNKSNQLTSNSETRPTRRRCETHTLQSMEPDENGRIQYFPAQCNSFTCPRCGPGKVVRRKELVADAIRDNQLLWMVTLTLPAAAKDPYQLIRQAWNSFYPRARRAAEREYFPALKYIRVLETNTRNPNTDRIHAHLHLAWNLGFEKDWIEEEWVRAGGGPKVDITKYSFDGAAALAGYLTKSLSSRPAEVKRAMSCSRGIALSKSPTTSSQRRYVALAYSLSKLYDPKCHEGHYVDGRLVGFSAPNLPTSPGETVH